MISRPCVRFEDGVFKMWYSYSMRGRQSSQRYRIGYAESLDGTHWERSRANPVLDVSSSGWDDEMVEYPEIDVVDGIYHMWYCGNGFGSVGYSEGIPETSVQIRTRTGPSVRPNQAWTDWSAPYTEPSGQPLLSPPEKYVQVRIRLASSNPSLTPAIRRVQVFSGNR